MGNLQSSWEVSDPVDLFRGVYRFVLYKRLGGWGRATLEETPPFRRRKSLLNRFSMVLYYRSVFQVSVFPRVSLPSVTTVYLVFLVIPVGLFCLLLTPPQRVLWKPIRFYRHTTGYTSHYAVDIKKSLPS